MKHIINNSNQHQNENLYYTSNFLLSVIGESNININTKLSNTSNILKEIINQSNTNLTELIHGCNENVSNYLNRLDILTSNITRSTTDESYIINTNVTFDGLLTTSNIIPKEDLVYDLGSVENRFKDLYIGDNSIWLGD